MDLFDDDAAAPAPPADRAGAARRAHASAHARRVRRPGGARSRPAGRCATRSSAIACSRSSSGDRPAPARRRSRGSSPSVTRAHFIAFSAVLSGIKEIREVMAEAEQARRRSGRRTILFIDEIHRFNKAQQDAFLPRVEAGDIVLIGATTENPSFEVNSALLSRSKVLRAEAARRSRRSSTILRRALRGSRARPRRAAASRPTTRRSRRSRATPTATRASR